MNRDDKKSYGVYFVALLFVVFLLFFSSIHSVLPRNALTLQRNMETWFPQGWGFYSKEKDWGTSCFLC